jgi:predicted phosphodiesterase
MVNYHQIFPFEFVILVGDNIYGSDKAEDMKKKFENVYKTLLNNGVKFYASLGNHDASNQRFYEFFNMKGEEYYRFTKGAVSFYSLNSNYMDERQLKWMENEFVKDENQWRIAFFHHPLYSSGGRRGPSEDLRDILEPVLIRNGFDVVFFGHDHFYERIKPQKGIYYFLTGAGGKISKDLKKNSPITDKGYDADLSFTLIEIDKDEMHFQTITRTGQTVDSGVIKRPN